MKQDINQDFNKHLGQLPENTQLQVLPAFFDLQNGNIYLSRFANGNLAPIHVYEGLPERILKRSELELISGFIVNGQFMTHEQTAACLSDTRE